MGLVDLPVELILLIVDQLSKPRDQANLMRTCRQLCVTVQTGLFKNLRLFNFYRYRFNNRLLSTLLDRPEYGGMVRRLVVDDWENARLSWPNKAFEGIEQLANFLLDQMPLLRSISIECLSDSNFLSRDFPYLERMTVQQQMYWWRIDPLNTTWLRKILLAPRLERFTLISTSMNSDQLLYNVNGSSKTGRFSTIKELELRIGEMSSEALIRLLNTPYALRTFRLSPNNHCLEHSLEYDAPLPGDTTLLPSMSAISAGLEQHKDSLHIIEVIRGSGYWGPNLDRMNSFRNFSMLKCLRVSLSSLLGFNHCKHRGNVLHDHSDSKYLSDLLPDSLEELHVTYDEFHTLRNGKTYILVSVQSIVDDRKRLSCLQKITIKSPIMLFGCYYCCLCRAEYGRRRAYGFTICQEEKVAIEGVLRGTNIVSRFLPDELYWSLETPEQEVTGLEHSDGDSEMSEL